MNYKTEAEFKEIYCTYVDKESLSGIEDKEQLDICGQLIDTSFHLKKEEGFIKAISFLKKIDESKLTKEDVGKLFYFLGNAYADLDDLAGFPNHTRINPLMFNLT